MKVIQFGFGDPGAHIYLPHRYNEHCAVYTGTHDNDTSVGLLENCSAKERAAAQAYFGEPTDGVHWAMIRAAESSVAQFCIIQLQDVLGLDSGHRMNIPSHPEGNWTWRYQPDALKMDLGKKLAAMTEVADRVPLRRGQQGDGEASENFSA